MTPLVSWIDTVVTGYPVWLAPSLTGYPVSLAPSLTWYPVSLASSLTGTQSWLGPSLTGSQLGLGTSQTGTQLTGTGASLHRSKETWKLRRRMYGESASSTCVLWESRQWQHLFAAHLISCEDPDGTCRNQWWEAFELPSFTWKIELIVREH